RKLQRLFRNPAATLLIKRCNDFGAGGVSVAIGELADGLTIDLNAVPKKYEGLDGTELAISESQERMAVVVAREDVDRFLSLAQEENLQACPVARVTEEPRLVMTWNGKRIVDIGRDFLNSNGAPKHIRIQAPRPALEPKPVTGSFGENMTRLAGDLNVCSRRGLSERFDSTIGAGAVLMPFGGKHQMTPVQAMVQKVSMEEKHTKTCSLMAWGYDPILTGESPFHGAYGAVVESVSKLVATGASFEDVYLTFQEYFAKPGRDPKRWGMPFAALLGAFRAQMDLGIGAIGGKDSMSGTFENLDVPPTLVSFAVTTEAEEHIVSNDFKGAGHPVALLSPAYDENGLPGKDSLLALFDRVAELLHSGKAVAAYTPERGGAAAAVMKMAFGNGLGFRFDPKVPLGTLLEDRPGRFLLELTEPLEEGLLLGETRAAFAFTYGAETLDGAALQRIYEDRLEGVYPCNIPAPEGPVENFSYVAAAHPKAKVHVAKPRVLIPVFPGTNCEYDSAKAVRDAGGEPVVLVLNNLSAAGIVASTDRFSRALKNTQMVFLPGGFSGGDEPDGSGKFITAFFRNERIKDGVTDLLDNWDGLMCGICNGFQALIKLGLVPFGRIMDTDESCPTLTYNLI
ncbi:MAG: phosphoribosylformylglycinamidine synthase subunit PurQ, partial [Clostridia bacterium]|nr:phosphoribosylformylglycinamidine synthase subunit PurQ [Clostridia bacterium]